MHALWAICPIEITNKTIRTIHVIYVIENCD